MKNRTAGEHGPPLPPRKLRFTPEPWTIMKGLCLALSIGVIFWIHNETADVITARLIIEAESPDQLWKAAVVQTDYETWPIITIVTSDVYLISLRDPANVADILAVNTAGTDDI